MIQGVGRLLSECLFFFSLLSLLSFVIFFHCTPHAQREGLGILDTQIISVSSSFCLDPTRWAVDFCSVTIVASSWLGLPFWGLANRMNSRRGGKMEKWGDGRRTTDDGLGGGGFRG